MLMRKGTLFRASRLAYDEIGCPVQAAAPVAALGLLNPAPHLTLDDLFALTTRAELLEIFAEALSLIPGAGVCASPICWKHYVRFIPSGTSWTSMTPIAASRARCPHGTPRTTDCVFRVDIAPLCDRLRLMFFGNLQQDWAEFVLADLGVFRYEKVVFGPASRAFQQRADVDVYLALHACRESWTRSNVRHADRLGRKRYAQ